jgi:phage baseplate assembly protein W
MKSEHLIENKAFLGRGWAFPVQFEQGDYSVSISEFENDVRESIIILLHTIKGERVMRPDYGTNVRDMIFEPLDTTTASLIGENVKRAILIHEPRVFVDKVQSDQDSLQGTVTVSIDYTIISTNTRYNLVYPLYLNEATDSQI